MYTVLLFIYLGGTTLPFVKCFSDGNFDDDQDVCQSMAVSHNDLASQDPASNPFTVDPDYVDVTVLGTVVTVSLTANSAGRVFRGFLLEARETNDGPPVGVFSLSDSSISRLQSCNGIVGRAVTQINNQNKTAVTVSWTTPNTGRYYFRATFVEKLDIFWNRKDISPPTTTTSTTSTSSTPFTTTSTSALTTVTSVPISTPQPDPTTITEVTSLVPTSTTNPATSVRASTLAISSTDTTVASTHAPYSASTLLSDPTTKTEVTSLVHTSITDPTTSSGVSTESFFSTDTTVTSTQAMYSASTQISHPTTTTKVTSLVPTSTTDPTTSLGASTESFSSTDITATSTHALHSTSTQLSDPTTTTEVTSLVPTSTTDPTTSLGMSTENLSSTDITVTTTHALHSTSTQLSDPTTITEVISLVPTSTTDPTKSSASTQLSDPTTTTQVTSLVPTSTNVPTASTGTTSAKSDLSVCKPGSDWFLILLLASYLSLVEGFPFLMKHRKRRNVVVMQVSSVLSLLFSLVAFIISLILTELVAAKVLTGLAVFLSLCQVIVIFSFCGPSHELRRQLCWAFGLVTFANICLTTAAIFVGLVKCKICLWLLIVMAAYLASDLLFYMLCLIFTFKKPGRISQRISFRSLCLVILTLVNIAFTVALIIGIFLCNYGTVTTKQSSGNM